MSFVVKFSGDFDRLNDLALSAVDKVPFDMRQWADEYRLNHGQEMEAVKFGSGAVTFRGEASWPAPVDQYTRKTDGVTVPPWGGVPKLVGRGTVKGKKRPSGKRVTRASTMMGDTAQMRRSGLTPQVENNGFRIVFETRGYGVHQHRRRRWLFFTEQDADALVSRLRRRFARLG